MVQGTAKTFKPVTEKEKWLTGQIVDTAIAIHRAVGPGLLKTVYEKCFCYELNKRNIPFIKQKRIDLVYDQLIVAEGLQVDILVDNLIIIEIKAQEDHQPVWECTLLSYLKLSGKRLGYILNFHVPLMKNGIKRMIYN